MCSNIKDKEEQLRADTAVGEDLGNEDISNPCGDQRASGKSPEHEGANMLVVDKVLRNVKV